MRKPLAFRITLLLKLRRYKTVVTPGDILTAYPEVWPFSQQLLSYYRTFTRPLPAHIDPTSPSTSLRIDAVFVYNDPRDWGLDAQIIKDVLLSHQGILGTLSSKVGYSNRNTYL